MEKPGHDMGAMGVVELARKGWVWFGALPRWYLRIVSDSGLHGEQAASRRAWASLAEFAITIRLSAGSQVKVPLAVRMTTCPSISGYEHSALLPQLVNL